MRLHVYKFLARTSLELLSEKNQLDLVVNGQNASPSNGSQNVCSRAVKEGPDAIFGNNLPGGIKRILVLDSLSRSHHHAASNSVQRIRQGAGQGGQAPGQRERGQEVVLERTYQQDRLQTVVESKVEATVHHSAPERGHKATIETGYSVGSQCLAVNIQQPVELPLPAVGCLCIVGEAGSGEIERIDEYLGCCAGSLCNRMVKLDELRDVRVLWGFELTAPEAMLPKSHFPKPSRSLMNPNIFLYLSLQAKFKAWVGK